MTIALDHSDEPAPRTDERLPWPFIAAGMVAFAAMYVTSNGFAGMMVLAMLLVFSSFTAMRLPANRVLGWIIRVTAWVVLISTSPDRRFTGSYILYEPSYSNVFGYLAAAEIVLRVWTRGDPRHKTANARSGPSRGEIVLLTALVFLAATNVYAPRAFFRRHIALLAPVYAALLILCLRSFAPRSRTRMRRRPSLLAMRVAVGVIAITFGFATVWAVNRYDYRLTQWFVEMTRGDRQRRGGAQIGLGTAPPQLAAVFNPTPSLDRVMKIAGSSATRYVRALAYDTYENRQWSPALRDRRFRQIEESTPTITNGTPLHLTRLDSTIELILLPPEAVIDHAAVERDQLGSLRHRDEEPPDHFDIVAGGEHAQGTMLTPIDHDTDGDEQRGRSLAVPAELDPRVAQLAREVAGDGDATARVRRIMNHLRGGHEYSLIFDPQGDDPLSDFILNHRAAHCQYFASAMVVMSRAAGVPARLVTGYYAHERSGDAEIVIRQRDAHAWAECWIDGIGWITVEATPASGRPNELYEASSGWRQFWEDVRDLPDTIRAWLARITMTQIAVVLAIAMAILSLIAIIRRLRLRPLRPRGKTRRYEPTDERIATLGRRFERWLRSNGVSVDPNRTWGEHLSMASSVPIDRASANSFIDTYNRLRFGPRDEHLLARTSDLIDTLEKS